MMKSNQVIAIIQVVILLACSFGIYTYANSERATSENGTIVVVDSNGVSYSFDEAPTRVAMTNTYAGVVMKMLDVDLSVVVGVSGDFSESDLWPEFESTPLVQNSAHSEIDFEALLDTRPEIYIVFATNGMVDTESIRHKLEPVGIHVLALDFTSMTRLEMKSMFLRHCSISMKKPMNSFQSLKRLNQWLSNVLGP